MKNLILSVFAVAMVSVSAFAQEVENELPTFHKAKVISARLVPTNGGINPMYMAMKVYATVEAGNTCSMPAEFIKVVDYKETAVKYQILAKSSGRACAMVYRPVYKEVFVGTYHGSDIMPIFTVNGIVASHR